MPGAMLEAQPFGHQKGSFTGATQASEDFFRAADGATLPLGEIAEMPQLQAKVLRVLQEGEVVPIGLTQPVKVDVRIVACANRGLPTEVAEDRFRADFYYRLSPLTGNPPGEPADHDGRQSHIARDPHRRRSGTGGLGHRFPEGSPAGKRRAGPMPSCGQAHLPELAKPRTGMSTGGYARDTTAADKPENQDAPPT